MALTQNDRDLMVKIADLDRRLEIQERNENQIWKGANFPTTGLYDRRKFTITTATRDEDFFYDLANTRWLSTTEYSVTIPFFPGTVRPITVATTTSLIEGPSATSTDQILLTTIPIFWFVQTTHNATNFWSVQFARSDSTNAAFNVGAALSSWQTGRLANTPYMDTLTLNTVVAQTGLYQIQLTYTPTAAPGSLFWDPPIMYFRKVG
jgi:hypothetical protein